MPTSQVTSNLHSLQTLRSLSGDQVQALSTIGIGNLGDLLAYQPLRAAQYLRAARDKLLRREEVLAYVDQAHRSKSLDELLAAPPTVLRGVAQSQADVLRGLGVRTVAGLAAFAAAEEAEAIVTGAPSEDDDPFAPACALPTCKKFSRNTKSFTSFFKEKEIRDLSVYNTGNSRIAHLFKFGLAENKVIHLGYSVAYLQEWIYLGVHLGEPQGSVNLAMGQDTQVSMVDWRRAMRALRSEDTRNTERLASALFHQRGVDEVARATAEEHQFGATSAFGANAATAGSFVAAGAVIGGVGGGISGALVGLSVDALTGGATLGLGTLGGAVAGSAVGSVAGAAAGSLIASGATTLGFVETDAEGSREVFATSAQRIHQRTVQNSSSIRSFWSNIVSQSVEEEQQTIRTDRITNHNRIHALNAILFEVLNGYRVNISAQSFAPVLFLPFKPFNFSPAVLRDYWWIIRTLIQDKTLTELLDARYLKLSGSTGVIEELAALPEIDDIRTARVTVKVNLDGSAIAQTIKNLAVAAGGLIAAGVVGLSIAGIVVVFREIFDATKRSKVKASLVTTNGTVTLTRDSFDAENFIWTFSTTSAVELASILAVRVINDNGEFNVLGVDLSELAFEDVDASLSIRNRNDFTAAVPGLRQLEDSQAIANKFTIGALSSADFPYPIGDQLRAKFEGVDTLRAELERDKLAIQSAEQAEAVLLGFLNANRFTFTRLILQAIEPEQVMTALEDVRIGDIDLSDIAGTTPIGFCANHVVLPMKACQIGQAKYDNIGVDTSKLELRLAAYDELERAKPAEVVSYLSSLRDFLKQFVPLAARTGNGSVRELRLLDFIGKLLALLEQVLALTGGTGAGRPPKLASGAALALAAFGERISQAIRRPLGIIRAPVTTSADAASRLCGHYASVKASLSQRMGEFLSSDEISLPSPAVFMEPVLSNAKGAELYDLRRNSHYPLLESPSIGAADPNVLRSQPVALTPTVPGATLSILQPPDLPLPNSLGAALAEAGKLDLSTLVQTNASSLTSMLSNLSTMATELAKASATLTGEAQQQALGSAADVAKQVGDIVAKSLQPSSGTAPPPRATASPQTQQEKAEVCREAERIDKSTATPQQKTERKRTVGAATTPDPQRNYQFSIRFLDEEGIPYVAGSFTFTLSMSIFEQGNTVDINGGQALDLSPEGFFFPETILLTRGRKVQLSLVANIGGVLVPGTITVTLPDTPDVAFVCTMKSETRDIQSTSVSEVMDTAVNTSTFGANAGVLFDLFLNAGAKFPFKLAEVTAVGAFKAVPDLKLAYNNSRTTSTGGTTTTTTTTTYKVTTPLNGWQVIAE
jgi:hypothetical protein